MNNEKKENELRIIFLLVLLIVPLQQIAIDLYLPSLPAMATGFYVEESLLKISITLYLLALGGSQFFYGPFSDRYGRRRSILLGMSLFLLASVGCVAATDIHFFLLARFLQGLGMGCGFVGVTAILGDTFKGRKLAKTTSYTSMVYSLAPLLAPVLGGYIEDISDWHYQFVFLSVYTALLSCLLYYYLPETLSQAHKQVLTLRQLRQKYLAMLKQPMFLGFVLCQLFAFSLMISFNVIGPFLLQDTLAVSAIHYGYLLFIIGAAYLGGTTLNRILLKTHSPTVLIRLGIVLMSVGSLLLTIYGFFFATGVSSIIASSFIIIFGSGFVFPNSYAAAIEIFSQHGGIASSLMGGLGLLGNAIISAIIAPLSINSSAALGSVYLLLSCCTWVSYRLTQQRNSTPVC